MRLVGLSLGLIGLGIAGCDSPAATHDRTYYATHSDARAEVLAECRNDPGRLGGTPNCRNALAAQSDVEHERAFHGARPSHGGVTRPDHL